VEEGSGLSAPMIASNAVQKWETPSHGWFKANWDATLGRNTGRLGVGIVIRDHHRELCAAKSWTRPGFLDPTAMEAMAAYMAIKMCTALGLQQIQLEGDAQKVVDAVNRLASIESQWGQLATDIISCLHNFQRWEMKYVSREANQGAYVLAKFWPRLMIWTVSGLEII
jgi:ribonuclease HI